MHTGAGQHTREPADLALRRAWWSLALYPLSLVAAFVVGEGLFTLVADDSADPSPWQVLLAGGPALLLFIVPGLLAWSLGRRATTLGRPDGTVPAAVGAAVAAGVVGLNLASYVAGRVLG